MAFIKTAGPQNNVIFERLNHQHRDSQQSNYPMSIEQQKSTLLEDQWSDCGTECGSSSFNQFNGDTVAQLSRQIRAKNKDYLLNDKADYANDAPMSEAGDNFDSASIADYSKLPDRANDDADANDDDNDDEDENESDGDSQMSNSEEDQSKVDEEEVDGEEVGEEEEVDWEEEEENVESSSDSEEEFIKYLPTHDPGQFLRVVSAEKKFSKYIRKNVKRALARRAATGQGLPTPNLREKRSLPPPTSPIAKKKRYNLSAVVPARDYDTITNHLIDLENLKKAGNKGAARELKALNRKFCDIDMCG